MKLFHVALVITVFTMGCASKKFVAAEIEESETRTQRQVEDLKEMVESTQTEIRNVAEELGIKIEGLEGDLAAKTGEIEGQAEDNANEIARLGHLSFRKTLSDAEAYFKPDSADLGDEVLAELDKFAQLLKSQNKMMHLEIQGHADGRGDENYNRKLGLKRAENVRDYLYKSHDIPLHLMNVISLGSEEPIADNSSREGRAQNRRVVLVVRLRM